MFDEQDDALTLDDLLGVASSSTPLNASDDLLRSLGSTSDLLQDLIGDGKSAADAPLSLSNLPALPKIPLQMTASPTEPV